MAAKPESPQRGLEGQQLTTWLFRLWTWVTQVWTVATGGTGLSTVSQGDMLYGSATDMLARLAKDANATRYVANTGTSNNPAWAQINLANGVTGDLPFANLTQGSALSVLGVTGNATADNASIAAGSDHQVMRRSGTSIAFGAVNIAQAAAVTGLLPAANGGAEAWAAFTVTRSGFTEVGTPTVTGRFSTVGNTVFFQVKIDPDTSVASTAGTSYIELPVAAAAASFGGDASMVNTATLISIGNAVIDVANSRCYVPSQAATGDTLVVAGWFEK